MWSGGDPVVEGKSSDPTKNSRLMRLDVRHGGSASVVPDGRLLAVIYDQRTNVVMATKYLDLKWTIDTVNIIDKLKKIDTEANSLEDNVWNRYLFDNNNLLFLCVQLPKYEDFGNVLDSDHPEDF